MQALIVHDDRSEADRLHAVLTRRGFIVTTLADQDAAAAWARSNVVDLLILAHVIDGRHTTSVALAGELRNPQIATVLLTARARADSVELFELVPSLRAILGPRPDGQLLGAIAIDALEAPPVLILSPRARVDAGDEAEPAEETAQIETEQRPSARFSFAPRHSHAA